MLFIISGLLFLFIDFDKFLFLSIFFNLSQSITYYVSHDWLSSRSLLGLHFFYKFYFFIFQSVDSLNRLNSLVNFWFFINNLVIVIFIFILLFLFSFFHALCLVIILFLSGLFFEYFIVKIYLSWELWIFFNLLVILNFLSLFFSFIYFFIFLFILEFLIMLKNSFISEVFYFV